MISMDKKYRTRDGQSVRVLCVDRNTEYPVVTLVGDDEVVHSYTSEGIFDRTGEVNRLDLVEVLPYDDFKIDDLVMVRNEGRYGWQRFHFAGIDKQGKPLVWLAGTTSYTVLHHKDVETWDECRRPTDEEMNRNKPKD